MAKLESVVKANTYILPPLATEIDHDLKSAHAAKRNLKVAGNDTELHDLHLITTNPPITTSTTSPNENHKCGRNLTVFSSTEISKAKKSPLLQRWGANVMKRLSGSSLPGSNDSLHSDSDGSVHPHISKKAPCPPSPLLPNANNTSSQDENTVVACSTSAYLSQEQQEAILKSWQDAFSRRRNGGATLFSSFFEGVYVRLFDICPEAKFVFGTGNTVRKALKIAKAVNLLMEKMGNQSQFESTVRSLAGLHVAINVTEKMFEGLGQALLESLAERLGDEWTDEVRDSWVAMYTLAVSILQSEMALLRGDKKKQIDWLVRSLGPRKDQLLATWGQVERQAEFAGKFYARLFEECPEVKPMFQNKPAQQHKALAGSIGELLKIIDRQDRLEVRLKALARIHAHLTITPEMCHHFCNCMVETLKAELHPYFTDDDDATWRRTMGLVAMVMASVSEKAGDIHSRALCSIQ